MQSRHTVTAVHGNRRMKFRRAILVLDDQGGNTKITATYILSWYGLAAGIHGVIAEMAFACLEEAKSLQKS